MIIRLKSFLCYKNNEFVGLIHRSNNLILQIDALVKSSYYFPFVVSLCRFIGYILSSKLCLQKFMKYVRLDELVMHQ